MDFHLFRYGHRYPAVAIERLHDARQHQARVPNAGCQRIKAFELDLRFALSCVRQSHLPTNRSEVASRHGILDNVRRGRPHILQGRRDVEIQVVEIGANRRCLDFHEHAPARLRQGQLMRHLGADFTAHGLGIDEQPWRLPAGHPGAAIIEEQIALRFRFAAREVGARLGYARPEMIRRADSNGTLLPKCSHQQVRPDR